MNTSQHLHPWDRALLTLFMAEQVARSNANLPLGADDAAREARAILATIRLNLRDASWVSAAAVNELLVVAADNLERITQLLNDGIERQDMNEAHWRAFRMLELAITPRRADLPGREGDDRLIEWFGNNDSPLKQQLAQVSSERSRAPKEWWLALWERDARTDASAKEYRFSLYLDVGGASVADIREVLASLNGLHQAAGGAGFVFSVEEDRLVMSPAVQ